MNVMLSLSVECHSELVACLPQAGRVNIHMIYEYITGISTRHEQYDGLIKRYYLQVRTIKKKGNVV